ncbi:unnamed protein product [Angiostrongylus costaricensis]|uniref:Ras-GEF domain-containing protein n=1 Tax=Angiostrongylus costaricensis TaxID=334426 RepID=A0A0R3PUB9_ANGCS|nr:unnamed protein product [Angiostrongylus costaricensis]
MTLSPLMGFLHPDNVHRMTDLAVELSSLAARSIAKNEKDVAWVFLLLTVSDITTQSRMSFLKAFAPLEHTTSGTDAISSTTSTLLTTTISDLTSVPPFHEELFDLGGLRDYVPGANNNFGLRKGPGCLPFLSEFMQVAYGNCQKVADEKAFDAWGDELKSAIYTGQIDLLKARLKIAHYRDLTNFVLRLHYFNNNSVYFYGWYGTR